MAFQPVGNTSRCELRMTHGTNRLENTFWYRWTGSPPTVAELLALAAAVGAGVGEQIRLAVSQGVVFREVYCRNMDTEVANQATQPFAPGTSGARVGNPVASNEACEIVRRTGQTGRSSHGAIRVSEFVEADVDGNTISSALMTLLGNVALGLLQNYVGGRFFAALGSRSRGDSKPLQAAAVLDSDVDSQKTRLNAHGT